VVLSARCIAARSRPGPQSQRCRQRYAVPVRGRMALFDMWSDSALPPTSSILLHSEVKESDTLQCRNQVVGAYERFVNHIKAQCLHPKPARQGTRSLISTTSSILNQTPLCRRVMPKLASHSFARLKRIVCKPRTLHFVERSLHRQIKRVCRRI